MEIFLGTSPSGQRLVWRNAENPHSVLTGRSGCGKSYFIKKLLLQAVQQRAVCLVLDYSGDFYEYSPPSDIPFQRVDVLAPEFTVNPLVGAANTETCAQQLLSLLHSAFPTRSRPTAALWKVVKDYLLLGDTPTLEGLLHHASTIENPSNALVAALEPLELLCALLHSGDQPISLDLSTLGLTVLDLTSVIDSGMLKIMVEIILRSIWNQQTSVARSSANPVILVLDECQHLDWGQHSMAIRILREGRKYDVAGWFSTQWLSNKEARAALGQAALQAHFRPDDQNITSLAKRLSQSGKADIRQCQRLVCSLRIGQFLWQRSDGRIVLVNVGD